MFYHPLNRGFSIVFRVGLIFFGVWGASFGLCSCGVKGDPIPYVQIESKRSAPSHTQSTTFESHTDNESHKEHQQDTQQDPKETK